MELSALAQIPPLPPEIERPKWAFFLWSRGLGIDDAVPVVQRSREYVRQLGLPWDHPQRTTPTDAEVVRIAAWSRGEIGAADWVAPERRP